MRFCLISKGFGKFCQTRMHSSGMHTLCCSGGLVGVGGGGMPRDVCLGDVYPGGCLPRGYLPRGICLGGVYPGRVVCLEKMSAWGGLSGGYLPM